MLQATLGTERNTLIGFFAASLTELAQNSIMRVLENMKVKAAQK